MTKIFVVQHRLASTKNMTSVGGWQLYFSCAFLNRDFATDTLADRLKTPIKWRNDDFGCAVFEYGIHEYRLTEMSVY